MGHYGKCIFEVVTIIGSPTALWDDGHITIKIREWKFEN